MKHLKILDKGFVTKRDKLNLYRRHQYSCDVPDVPTAAWTDGDWIKWIDDTGSWWVVAPPEGKKT